jgi:hypothetical protein
MQVRPAFPTAGLAALAPGVKDAHDVVAPMTFVRTKHA